jgi:hypothetical protein
MAKSEKKVVGYIVVSHFRDINDFNKVYEPGDDIADLPEDRIRTLLDRGLIEEVVDEKAAAKEAKAAAEAAKKAEAEQAEALKKQQEEEAAVAAEEEAKAAAEAASAPVLETVAEKAKSGK